MSVQVGSMVEGPWAKQEEWVHLHKACQSPVGYGSVRPRRTWHHPVIWRQERTLVSMVFFSWGAMFSKSLGRKSTATPENCLKCGVNPVEGLSSLGNSKKGNMECGSYAFPQVQLRGSEGWLRAYWWTHMFLRPTGQWWSIAENVFCFLSELKSHQICMSAWFWQHNLTLSREGNTVPAQWEWSVYQTLIWK